MFATPAHRLTGLLSAVALLLLLLAPVLASAAPMPAGQMANGMMAHGHDSSYSEANEHSCWQQCLNSCTSHCAPVLAALPLASVTSTSHGPMRPDLYQHLFPSGLHRPPKA
ncbi:hypothetical protein GCM10009104_15550 [Marinobacterium maritimum]|uniref:Uncharacterized protein n=1 Tax=Marinobacterium maritimum TaxID=500162 RepID=A0ABN1I5F2_9GAMM